MATTPRAKLWAAHILLTCMALMTPCRAQDVRFAASTATGTGSLSGYEDHFFQLADGLPEGTVQAFAQTPDRYLWIGTTGGLVRYDGANFKVFDRENTPAFHENSVFCMLTAQDGSLWIGMEGSGLVHLAHGEMRAYGVEDGLTDTFVRAIAQDHNGNIWIGTNNGLFQLRKPETDSNPAVSAIHRIDGLGAIPSIAVNAIWEDSLGRIWLGGSELIALQSGVAKSYRLDGESSRNRVKSIAETSDGTIWVGTVSGLHRLARDDRAFQRVPNISGTVRVLRQTHDGNFWISIVGRGGAVYKIGPHGELGKLAPLPRDAILSIFEDAESNIWLGTQAGMIRLSKTPVILVPLPDARDSDFGTVFLDHTGVLWAASTHLFRIHDGIAHPFNFPGLKSARIRNVFQDRSGIFWVGTEGSGLYRLDSDGPHHFDTRNGLVNNFIRVILQGADGAMWIGTDEGVSRLQNNSFKSFDMNEGLAYISIRSMLEDQNHDIWIGTEQGLSHLHHDTFLNDAPVQELRREKVWAIYRDSSGTIWFGTRNNGLFRYSNGIVTHISTAEGLPTKSIYQILEDHAGHLWLSGASGVWLLNLRQLHEVEEGRPTHLAATFYSIANDSETDQLYGGMQSAGCISPSGDVWYPSNRGDIRIRPEIFAPPLTPPLLIDGVNTDGRAVAINRPIKLYPGSHMLEIAYGPIMLHSQIDMRFRYKLDGIDKDWIDAGSRRVAYYTSLPPGSFHFHVQTFSINSPSSISEASVTIEQQPHFYRTWWFIACCLLTLAGIILGIYRFRIDQMRRRFAAVLEERSRLAREMHDTLLQGCTSVSVVLEAVSSVDGVPDDGLKQHLLDCARTQIRTTIDEAREAVWRWRQPTELTGDLARMLNTMAQLIAVESGVQIESQTSPDAFFVPQNIAREVTMVAREAVHNAILHAAPSKVTLHTARKATTIVITIEDDGRGFDPAVPAAMQGKHFGLVGMRERAAHIGGTLEVNSSRGSGTRIVLSVPMRVIASVESEF
jgi:ligand-binding sensor domain-containing protein